jgi:hypothetical protein
MLTVAGLAVIAGLSSCGNGNNPLAPLTNLDTTPPPAPTNLESGNNAFGQAVLVWDESSAPDLAGYQVLVFSALAGDYVPVDDSILVGATYSIPSDTYGTSASYRVRAVDVSGNWSAPSSSADVLVPASTGGGGGLDPFEER